MDGKQCLITGGTNGIGLIAARELARQGAHVVIVGRNPEKTAHTVELLRQTTGNPNISSLLGDMSYMADVRRVAREYTASHSRLDVLLNNAGAFFGKRLVTKDGYEMTFALNHLGYYTLTRDLMDLLKRSAPARVVNVTSEGHRLGRIDFDDLMKEKRFFNQWAYTQSKLANIMFTLELARRLEGTGVTANCVHPGIVATSFGKEHPSGLMNFLIALFGPLMLTSEQGADTLIWLSSSPEVEGVTGKYFIKRKERRPKRQARNPMACARLWEVSEQLVNKAAP
ncbi:MAG: SDR family oxidoreductase [Hyalangium sp.]|uniref:SDR family oxidoreductase n=1 Tax=Hyalangium sp. TaxID=2028555 RepID=UPI003899B529